MQSLLLSVEQSSNIITSNPERFGIIRYQSVALSKPRGCSLGMITDTSTLIFRYGKISTTFRAAPKNSLVFPPTAEMISGHL